MARWEQAPIVSQSAPAWASAPLVQAAEAPLIDELVPADDGNRFLDIGKKVVGTLSGMAGGIADIADPDPIAPGESRIENLRAGAGGALLSLLDFFTPDETQAAGVAPADITAMQYGLHQLPEPSLDPLREFVTETQTERAQARAIEDALRIVAGKPTLAEEREESIVNRFADEAIGFGDYIGQEAVSESQKQADKALSEVSQAGALPTLGYAFSHPLDFASSVGPSSAAYLVPAGVAGRVAGKVGKVSGLSDDAARSLAGSAGITAVGGTATVQNASQTAAAILNADPAELTERSPLFGELIDSGLSPTQAQAEMATRAFTQTLISSGVSNAVTLGLAAKYRGNVLEDWIAGRAPSVGRGVASGAATGTVKELVTEAAQEGGDAAATGIGEVGGGVRPLGEMFADVPGAAATGALASAPGGGVVGGVEGARARDRDSKAPEIHTETDTRRTPIRETWTQEQLQAHAETVLADLDARAEDLSEAEASAREALQALLDDPAALAEVFGVDMVNAEPDAQPKALPAPALEVDASGQAATRTQRDAAAAEQQNLADALGLTPDIQRAVEAQAARDAARRQPSQPLALPAPGPITVDRAGAAGTQVQRDNEARAVATAEQAERERRGQLGLTPDIERVAAVQEVRDNDPFAPKPPPTLPEMLDREDVRAEVAGMKDEAGWDTVGGRMIRKSEDWNSPDYNEIVGRTPWLPRAEWWPGRPGAFNETKTARIIDRGLAGERLGSKQQEYFDYLVEVAHERIELSRYLPEQEILAEVGLEDNIDNAFEMAFVAKAIEVNEDAVERLAIQHEGNDTEFLRAVKALVAQNEEADARSAEDIGARASETGDIFGDDTRAAQSVADESRRRDARRNTGQESTETGDPSDLFSQARQQRDIEDDAAGIDDEFSEVRRFQSIGRKVGLERAVERARSYLGSRFLGREFNETQESFYARNPKLVKLHEWVLSGGSAQEGGSSSRSSESIEVEELSPESLTPEQRHTFGNLRRERDESRAEAELDTQLEQQAAEEGQQQAAERGMDKAVNDLFAGAKNAPAVEFVNGWNGVPADARKRAKRSPGTRTEGLYDPKTNRVFILTDSVKTPERAAWVAAHEIAGHRGLHGVFNTREGKARLDTALKMARQNTTVRNLADEIRRQRTNLSEIRATEEAIAELAAATRTGNYAEIESRYKIKVPEGQKRSIKAAISNFIARIKRLLGRGDAYSDADVRKLIEDAWRYVREGDSGADTVATNPVVNSESAPDDDVSLSEAPKPRFKLSPEARRILQSSPTTGGAVGWNFDEKRWEGHKGELRRARAELQDKMLSWRDAQENIAEALGETIPDAQNVYRLETLMHGRVKEGLDALEESQIAPLAKAISDSGIDVATLEEYLYARHAQERNAQISEINPKMPDGGSGMTNAEADAILKKLAPQKAKLDALARRVDAITRKTRRRLLGRGLITQEQFDALEAQYQHYVPLRGKDTRENEFSDQGQGGAARGVDTRQKPVKQALGRGAGNRAVNILGEIIGDAQRSIIQAEKARVGRAALRLARANPNPKLWEVEPVQTERKLNAAGEVYEAVVNDWSDPSIIAVRENGKLYKLQIHQVQLAKALNHVGVDQMGKVTRMAGALNRYFSAILTRYNPAFIPVNASRDAIFGLTGLAVDHGEIVALRAAAYYPTAIRASWRQSRRKPVKSKADQYAKEFAEDGGKTGYVHMPSVEEMQRNIGSGKLTGHNPEGVRKMGRALIDIIGAMNDSVENGIRFSAYVILRERGMSREAAAEYAKNMTVNFNRKGYSGSRLNAWLLFYNASMQGAKRSVDLMRKPKTWGYLSGLAGAQVAAVMYAMGQEDDEGEPIWNNVSPWVKQRNLVFTWLDDEGEQQLLTIPMPYGFNALVWFAGRTTSAMMQEQDRPQDSAAGITGETISTLTQSFSPVPLDDGVMGLVPTALRIPLSIQTNRDDFGRQVRRENPFSKFDVPRATIGRQDTLEIFKLTAKGLNRLGGGDDYTPPPLSAFDVAPEDIEYLLDKFTGGIGRFVVDTATLGQKLAGDAPVTSKDIPITSRFFSQVDDEASEQALFYDRREVIERDAARIRDVYERDGEKAALELLRATPSLQGAAFRRYKRGNPEKGKGPGDIIEYDGRPQFVSKENSVYGRYKAASDTVSAINESIRNAYTDAPASLLPNAERDKKIRELTKERAAAQKRFNAIWVSDVVNGR